MSKPRDLSKLFNASTDIATDAELISISTAASAYALSEANDYTDSAVATLDAFPDQTGNSGKYLTTDGSNTSWGELDLDSAVTTASAAAVNYLIDGAPDALNTLNEIAAALDDNPDVLDLFLTQQEFAAASASFYRWTKAYSASTTLLQGADDNAIILLYNPGYEQVFINGVMLDPTEYTRTSASVITLDEAVVSGEVVDIFAYRNAFSTNTYTQAQIDAKYNSFSRWQKIYSASASVITGLDDNSNSLSYTAGYEQVYLNGILLTQGVDYTQTDSSTITLGQAVVANDVIEILSFQPFNIGDTYTQAQIDAKYNNRTRWTKTFSASATILSGADDNAIDLSYTSGYEEVYLNGILLIPVTDYARTSASVITLSDSVVSGDIIDVVNVSPFNVASTYSTTQIDAKYNNYTRWTKTLSASATLIEGNDDNSLPLSYTPGAEQVYVNGSLIMRDDEYTASSGSTVVLSEAGVVDDVIDIISFTPFNVTNVYTKPEVDTAFAPVNAGGLVLLNKTDFTAASTVSVDNVFSSTYKAYKVIIDHSVSTALTTTIRLRTSGADDSNANYLRQYLLATGATVSGGRVSAQTSWILNAPVNSRASAEFLVINPFENLPTTAQCINAVDYTLNNLIIADSYAYTTTTSFDGLSLIASTGNITGFISVYGYKNEVE